MQPVVGSDFAQVEGRVSQLFARVSSRVISFQFGWEIVTGDPPFTLTPVTLTVC